eukprot:CAMPEP_0178941944 /NCGR_PEP_ID=MMETSP0789-20121207/1705_1 /TAXON_ID=3005 /ORGANISM="Rhizosolenia setigera, Strain CCMP 1694" /LENGTH=467 /DNA_ID=CAMNT_0020621269 /DNA_START=178 /DNA_END=1581 /DNA_ORIENTATION=-
MSDFKEEEVPGEPAADEEEGVFTTEENEAGFCERLKDSLIGICFGFLFLFGSIALIFWNERNALVQNKVLLAGENNTVAIDVSPMSKINASFDQKLVYFNTTIKLNDTLMDPEFGVKTTDGMLLKRVVEQYQWMEIEETHKNGKHRRTTYTYLKVWSETNILSDGFYEKSHKNPGFFMVGYDSNWKVDPVTVGPWKMSNHIVDNSYKDFSNLPAGSLSISNIPKNISNIDPYIILTKVNQDEAFYISNQYRSVAPKSSSGARQREMQTQQNSTSTVTTTTTSSGTNTNTSTATGTATSNTKPNPTDPSIGDERVYYKYVKTPLDVSVIAKQTGNTFDSYINKKFDVKLFLVEPGLVSQEQMYLNAIEANKITAMIIRFVGVLLMTLAFYLMLRPLEVVADLIPFSCVGDLVGSTLICVSFTLAALLSMIFIGIAWIAARPMLAIPLFSVSIAGAAGLCCFAAKRGAS